MKPLYNDLLILSQEGGSPFVERFNLNVHNREQT